ncbi:unnamed protein product [Rhizophagus irregularis]|nr:unnamed protein product [Rhizophagus irregularis]CAB5378624.1 unnamed protein product [Rhizophagus irregularis]
MKILSKISFIFLIGLICLTQLTLSQKCLEYLRPVYRYETKVIDCPMVSTNDKRQSIPTSNDLMFIINFKCLTNDKITCGKVENVLITAGKFITATLNLKTAITVDAQFLNYCLTYGDCDQEKVILGSTRPARMIPIQDTDGKVRLYPQALLKQLELPEHPQYGPSDIITSFNSDTNFWFEGDPLYTLKDNSDMLYVVVHELIHGLGFTTAWRDYFNIQAIIPVPGYFSTDTKGQFFEFGFDKNLVLLPSGKSLTSIADELNKFPIKLDITDNEFISSFLKSPQFPIAKNLYKNAVTHGTIGFLITPNLQPNTPITQDDVVLLETSLNPFLRGSSLAHVDAQTYFDSSDFLMMYSYPKISLGQMMFNVGSTNTTGPIGPKLRLLLGTLGYEVKKDYIPPVKLSNLQSNNEIQASKTSIPSNTIKSQPSADTNNIEKNDSSLVNFNFLLSIICILLSFTYSIYSKY